MKTLRIFISSPGDVGRERHATAEIIRRLQSEFAEYCTLDPYFWEWEPVDFSKDYQSNIPSTADFDIVICILWSRLGSRLSDRHKLPPDYTRPASSGTEYELLQALHGQQQHPDRLPDLLVWKNDSPPPPASAPPLSREEEDERIRQRRALQDFLTSVTKDAATGSFIASLNSYQYLDQFEELMEGKLRKLIQKHIGQRTVKPKPQWQGSPFRDLDVFEFEHAPIFFGRSRAVGEVVRLLQSTLSKPQSCHFALILGASGSGKSSLARAGVLPLLTRPGVIEGIGLWRCAIVRPSDDSADLFRALAAALLNDGKKMDGKISASDSSSFATHFFSNSSSPPALPELADPESPTPQQSLAAELRAHPQTVAIRVKDQLNAVAKAHKTQQCHAIEAQITSLTQEGRLADAALKQQALQSLQEPKARLVLLLDQMEELFTLNYAPEQLRDFLVTIAVLARSGRVFVIGTLRSDFYPRYQEQPTLVALARDGARFDLLPPTPDEISQIIRRPASLAALQFEPHPTTAEHTLADTLRDEALADTEALPLLEHVLNRLYQAQSNRNDGRLTFADHATLGGVGGALGKHAEDIFTGQHRKPTDTPPPWTEDSFRAVFRCLVTFGKGEGDTDVPNRRAFTYQDLIQSDPAAQALVDTFIHERLLIADTDAQSRPIVRLSHEALLTRWPRLANWLQTAPVRDLMSQRRRLESSLRQWQEQERNSDYLLVSGLPLEEAKQLLEKHEAALKPEEREFVQLSHIHQQAKERRRHRLRMLVITILALLLVGACVGAYLALAQSLKASQQQSRAEKLTDHMMDDLYSELLPLGRLDLLDQTVLLVKSSLDNELLGEPAGPDLTRILRLSTCISRIRLAQGRLQESYDVVNRAKALIHNEAQLSTVPSQEAYAAMLSLTADLGARNGRWVEATDASNRAIQIYRALTEEKHGAVAGRLEAGFAECLVNTTDLLRAKWDIAAAGEMSDKAVGLARMAALNEDHDKRTEAKRILLRALLRAAKCRLESGNASEALTILDERRGLISQYRKDDAADAQWATEAVVNRIEESSCLMRQEKTKDAVATAHVAAKEGTALTQRDPGNFQWRWTKTKAHIALGECLHATGDFEQAKLNLVQANDELDAMVQMAPSNCDWQKERITVLLSLLSLALDRQMPDEAAEHLSKAEQCLKNPDVVSSSELRLSSSNVASSAGRLSAFQGHLDEAIKHHGRALRFLNDLMQSLPSAMEYRLHFAAISQELAETMLAASRQDEAKELVEKGIVSLEAAERTGVPRVQNAIESLRSWAQKHKLISRQP